MGGAEGEGRGETDRDRDRIRSCLHQLRPTKLQFEVGSRVGSTSRDHCPNGFLGLSLNDKTILFQMMLLDKTVSVG